MVAGLVYGWEAFAVYGPADGAWEGVSEESVGVGVERTNARLESAVEERGQVGIDVEVGLGDFVKVDAKDPAVELEAWDAEVVGDLEFVEAAP